MGIDIKINRDFYLRQLIDGRHNGLIKIVTGIRRCGKSYLLFRLFRDYLMETGVDEQHVIEIAFDDIRMESMRKPHNMINYVESRIVDDEMYYVLLDEVQMLDRFTEVLNSLLHIRNVDVYVTGSNSRFLSSDVATEFRGRGDEIHLYPLSFSELYSAIGGDKKECWHDYYVYGGLPQVHLLNGRQKREEFLINMQKSVYLRDLTERNRIKNKIELQELLCVLASSIGSPCNPMKLSNTFKSVKGVTIDRKTINRYLKYMEEAFILERALKYDIKGKKYINSLSKYYFQDMGLRNALLDFRQIEENHIMENVIYNELRQRGYRVDVGMVEVRDNANRKQLEVDFVANSGNRRYYIQSAFLMPDDRKREQEMASLKRIDDSFRRIIIVRDDIVSYHDENGFLIISLLDFLLNPDSLDK